VERTCPDLLFYISMWSVATPLSGAPTSLGEEGGESLVVIGGLALFGEITIRLYAVSAPSHRVQC
jgi:hypothetical protein